MRDEYMVKYNKNAELNSYMVHDSLLMVVDAIERAKSIKSVNIMDPTSEVSRFEDKVRHEEAMAKGMTEVAASSLDAQFASLDDASADLDVDARLAELKKGG